MTATKLQDLARVLSNQSWCRHWLNLHSSHTDVIMAIQCRDSNGKPTPIYGVNDGRTERFACHTDYLYTIPRTNEDGTPFESKLF